VYQIVAYTIKLLIKISVFLTAFGLSNFVMNTNASSISDSILIDQYLHGSEPALEKLIRRHKARIYNFINSKVQDRDTAEDLFQDTFIKVIRTVKGGHYNEEGKFLPWVMRIAHNLVIDYFRKSNRMPRVKNNEEFDVFQLLPDGAQNAEYTLVQEQIVQDLQNLVQELPEDQKEVLIMRIYRDMSFKEIAENTNVSINTALGRMRYAIINLRKLIAENQISLSI
jgi:RNA polymerase sigma factor (sigma-70 family)